MPTPSAFILRSYLGLGSQFANYISRTLASAITSNTTSIITPVGINMARSFDGWGAAGGRFPRYLGPTGFSAQGGLSGLGIGPVRPRL